MHYNIIFKVSILGGKQVMTCILYRSSAALFSLNSNVFMRSSLYGLPKDAWKRDMPQACIGVIRLDWFLLGFGIRCFSTPESPTSGISKGNPNPLIEEGSDAFFVVQKGDIIGVYKSLSDCQAQVGSSVCEPSVSVYKGYSLHKDNDDYLASRGLKDSLYSMHAEHLTEDIFGSLVPCPFQQPDGLAFLNDKASKRAGSKKRLQEVGTAKSGDASPVLSNKLCKSTPFVEAQPMTCILEFDGASKGNPGKSGAAAVLRKVDGSVVSCIREGLGIATNNVAEYRALILGMKYALMKGFKNIQVQGDSQLICMQVQDLWQTKNQNLAALCKEVKRLKEMFQSFNIIHVKRGFNAVADNLACSAITLPAGEVCEDRGPFN